MTSAPIVILSPHFDDAVVSAWHALTSDREVLVVNFFTAVPPEGLPLTMADRLAGVSSSAELVRMRHQEDREALSLVGRDSITLDFTEDQYRTEPVTAGQLRDALLAQVTSAASVLAPAAIGAHPDHELVRDVGLLLADNGWTVELYADMPYAVRYGWPEWMTGVDPGPHLHVEAWWQDFLDEITGRGHKLTQQVCDLGEAGSEAKLEAMKCHATQFQQLNNGIVNRLSNPLIRRYELSWQVD